MLSTRTQRQPLPAHSRSVRCSVTISPMLSSWCSVLCSIAISPLLSLVLSPVLSPWCPVLRSVRCSVLSSSCAQSCAQFSVQSRSVLCSVLCSVAFSRLVTRQVTDMATGNDNDLPGTGRSGLEELGNPSVTPPVRWRSSRRRGGGARDGADPHTGSSASESRCGPPLRPDLT